MTTIDRRTCALAGASVGLGAAALSSGGSAGNVAIASLGIATGCSLAGAVIGRARAGPSRWLGLGGVLFGCCLLGLVVGQMRLSAISDGAAEIPIGSVVEVEGVVTAWSVGSDGSNSITLSSSAGRLALEAGAGFEPTVGEVVRAVGVCAGVPEWRADWFAQRGIISLIEVRRIAATGERRGGIPGAVDSVRIRSEKALGAGMPPTEAALARGFVLGQDQSIPPLTEDEFRRSGLAHLLAVSGQNVVLLSILAWPFLALIGLRLPGRLAATIGLVAFYVLVTGAGPSIQRAGIMGVAALLAGLAGRPMVRFHALLLAAVITLAINPRAISDPGWLLSFAATAGIMAWAVPLARAFGAIPGESGIRQSIVEAMAVTVSATLATAPLGAAIFGTSSVTALPANIAALPAVAPAMWLGMISAAVGQISSTLAIPINWVNARLLAFIEQIAHLMATPEWAVLDLGSFPLYLVPLSWLIVGSGVKAVCSHRARRSGLDTGRRASRWLLGAGVAVAGLILLAIVVRRPSVIASDPAGDRLVVCALDVGQGDAILLDPPGPSAALVDTGPPGSDLAAMLRERGVVDLSALILTHDQSDHIGEAGDLMRSIPIRELAFARLGERLKELASVRGIGLRPVAEGGEIQIGEDLAISVLWPPRTLIEGLGGDPNDHALVLLARWRHFTALLTADAEAEAVPVEPGPVDLLKVAHHGSRDAGLNRLLEYSVPKLALVSVGAGNPYGHPTPETLSSLSSHQVPLLRTDRDGSVGAAVGPGGWTGGRC